MNENRWGRGKGGKRRERYSAKGEAEKRGTMARMNERDEDGGIYECLCGTYVGPPGADPLGGALDIRHRKPREIVPQVSADAFIKTR